MYPYYSSLTKSKKMNKLIINLFLFFTVFFISSCEQGEIATIILEEEQVDIFLKGQISEPEDSDFSDFSISLGLINETDGYLFWQNAVTERPFQKYPFDGYHTTLIMGAYPSDDGTSQAYFGFQFWPEEAIPNQSMTKAQLEDFFAPGNSFTFGEGEGQVDVALRLPIGGPYAELRVSKSSFLDAPQGNLTIIEMEDYTYTERITETITGKLIRCTIEGQIGRYDISVDTSDGMPWFETDEVVEVSNTECVFFVEYK